MLAKAESRSLVTRISAQTLLRCLLSELRDFTPRACWEVIWVSQALSSLGYYYVFVVNIYHLSIAELTVLLGNFLNAFLFDGSLPLPQLCWLGWSRCHSTFQEDGQSVLHTLSKSQLQLGAHKWRHASRSLVECSICFMYFERFLLFPVPAPFSCDCKST